MSGVPHIIEGAAADGVWSKHSFRVWTDGVVFQNLGGSPVDLAFQNPEDIQINKHVHPTGTLQPGEYITVAAGDSFPADGSVGDIETTDIWVRGAGGASTFKALGLV